MNRTVQELLYLAVFPVDPIKDWADKQLSEIKERYKKVQAIFDEALQAHRMKYNPPSYRDCFSGKHDPSASGGNGGSGAYCKVIIRKEE